MAKNKWAPISAAEYNKLQQPSKSKYKNKAMEIDGIRFMSAKEGKRYTILKWRLNAGEIEYLHLQVPIPIEINGVKVCNYLADFCYHDLIKGKFIFEDVKGFANNLYKLKCKLVRAVYGITILET